MCCHDDVIDLKRLKIIRDAPSFRVIYHTYYTNKNYMIAQKLKIVKIKNTSVSKSVTVVTKDIPINKFYINIKFDKFQLQKIWLLLL